MYSEPTRTSKMELLTKIVKPKSSILDVRVGSQHAPRKWKSLLVTVCFMESVVDSKICKNRSQKLASATVSERLLKDTFHASFTKYFQSPS